MKRLKIYAWIMSTVVFVGTLPHVVGAILIKPQKYDMETKEMVPPCEPTISHMKKTAKRIARAKVLSIYRSNYEWKSLYKLWDRESRWDYTADNPRSSAYGIPQMLKMPEDTPMVTQIELGLKYIKHRYGSPSKALAFHNSNGWY
jgi:hypothetical protein